MSKIIDNTFDLLGYVAFDQSPTASASAIADIQEQLVCLFPHDYQYFLENYGCCNFEQDVIFRSTDKSDQDLASKAYEISFFYGVQSSPSIEQINEVYSARIPQKFLAIAELAGGDQLLINCDKTSKTSGQVFVWKHDEADESNSFTFIANDFETFIGCCEKNVVTQPSAVLSSSFDF